MNPTENRLLTERIQVFGVAYLRVADYVRCQDFFAFADVCAGAGVVAVGITENVAVAFFKVQRLLMKDMRHIGRQQCTAVFIFFMANGESDRFHCFTPDKSRSFPK